PHLPPPLRALFFCACYAAHPALHSSPTRRSSDLSVTRSPWPLDCIGAHMGQQLLVNALCGAAECKLSQSSQIAGREIVANGNLTDRKSTRLNSSHVKTSYAVLCLKKKNQPAASAF